ncbi:MAG: nucleotidyltransferase domain-containing protein [Candidatus Electrothrix sp. ATG1]|nr:nucleotidyltransferase domain-containing protein [Candidatus Electrothrix sp. ATG1]
MLQNYLTELKPYKAVLFGSYAYGEIHDDSDIDLIMVLNKEEMPKVMKNIKSRYETTGTLQLH